MIWSDGYPAPKDIPELLSVLLCVCCVFLTVCEYTAEFMVQLSKSGVVVKTGHIFPKFKLFSFSRPRPNKKQKKQFWGLSASEQAHESQIFEFTHHPKQVTLDPFCVPGAARCCHLPILDMEVSFDLQIFSF